MIHALRARLLVLFAYVVPNCRVVSYIVLLHIVSCHRGCGVRGAHLGAPAHPELRSSRVVRGSSALVEHRGISSPDQLSGAQNTIRRSLGGQPDKQKKHPPALQKMGENK